MAALSLFLVAAAFAAPQVGAAAPAPAELDARRLYGEVRHCIVDANLLLTSAQARLKRLQFAYQELQAPALSKKAHDAFEALTDRLAAFRAASDDAEANGPMRSGGAPSAGELSRHAPPAEAPTAKLLEEVAQLRAAYDAEASRRSLLAVRKDIARFGPLKSAPVQQRTLEEGDRLRDRLRQLERELTLAKGDKPMKPVQVISAEREGLRADVKALSVELELLAVRFRLDNWLKAHRQAGPS